MSFHGTSKEIKQKKAHIFSNTPYQIFWTDCEMILELNIFKRNWKEIKREREQIKRNLVFDEVEKGSA